MKVNMHGQKIPFMLGLILILTSIGLHVMNVHYGYAKITDLLGITYNEVFIILNIILVFGIVFILGSVTAASNSPKKTA